MKNKPLIYPLIYPLMLVVLVMVASGCKKKEKDTTPLLIINPPVVTTFSVNTITSNSAISGGHVSNNGTITAKGICYDTIANPTISKSVISAGSDTGSYTVNITGLLPSTTYYLRAYASNTNATTYGNQVSFMTSASVTTPVLTTLAITAVTSVSAKTGGHITSDGGDSVTSRGVCLAISPNPTIADNLIQSGSDTGSYSINMTGLTGSTTYYIRAFATNSAGTSYGNEINFTTSAPLYTNGAGVTDIDGNNYTSVIIGTQEWMSENLKTTKYNDGTNIRLETNATTWNSLTTAAYCWFNNDQAGYMNKYGALYNWYTVDTGKLCPTGWHVPSDAEITNLVNYLGGANYAGGKMKTTGITDWLSPNTGATNSSGFSGLPGGYRHSSGTFLDLGKGGYWWSSTIATSVYSIGKTVDNTTQGIYSNWYIKTDGFSVRCLKD